MHIIIKEAFVQRVLEKVGDSDNNDTSRIEREIAALETKVAELEAKFDRLYDDRLNGILSDRKLKELSSKCEAEQDAATAHLAELREKYASRDDTVQDVQRFVDLVSEYNQITALDGEKLNHLVHKIVDGERSTNGDEVEQKVTVSYRFIGALSGT